MSYVEITAPAKSHMLGIVKDLLKHGWRPISVPAQGILSRNGQLLILKADKNDIRLRLFIYKITGSSRGRIDERRIEITSTYKKGLKRLRDYQDVVLGIDAGSHIFVGVDPRRIEHGGPTGNASSFFDKEGLYWKKNEILVKPRKANLFPSGLEFHAFFKSQCLAEYLLNVEAIHTGSYSGYGLYSGSEVKSHKKPSLAVPESMAKGPELIFKGPRASYRRGRVGNDLVRAFEYGEVKKLRRAKLSPERLLDIKRRCEENGMLGEEIVLKYERSRLRRAGRKDLSEKVRWISQESASEGYDILSFETDGKKRLIEVKSTSGNGRVFEMSDGEWQTAMQAGSKYYLYRVTNVRIEAEIKIFNDLGELERKGLLKKAPCGWWITLI
jgi:hypothetical protein